VNVGGFYQDAKVSSPPMTDRNVGGVIVVGARESRVHGAKDARKSTSFKVER
jgi:hypothetical protein